MDHPAPESPRWRARSRVDSRRGISTRARCTGPPRWPFCGPGWIPPTLRRSSKSYGGWRIDVATSPDQPVVRLDGERVDGEIRSAPVTAAVSAVSAISGVRTRLVARQRELISGGSASGLSGISGIVVEGRDIGSVVWPQADVKVFLTATSAERARRRAGELPGIDVDSVEADLSRRDSLDSSRSDSPLQIANGAVELDTTGIGVDGVVDRVVELMHARRHED